jgi:hypothetical protein
LASEIRERDAGYARQRLFAGEESVRCRATSAAFRLDFDVCEQAAGVECMQGVGRYGDDVASDAL